mgnify:FL=1
MTYDKIIIGGKIHLLHDGVIGSCVADQLGVILVE